MIKGGRDDSSTSPSSLHLKVIFFLTTPHTPFPSPRIHFIPSLPSFLPLPFPSLTHLPSPSSSSSLSFSLSENVSFLLCSPPPSISAEEIGRNRPSTEKSRNAAPHIGRKMKTLLCCNGRRNTRNDDGSSMAFRGPLICIRANLTYAVCKCFCPKPMFIVYDERFFLTVSGHAEREALLQPAELAPVPVDPVHHAVLLARALVVDHRALAAAEEALAALAGDHAVVHPARLVAAHLARDDLDLGCNTKREGRRQFSSILRNSDEYLDCALDQILTPSLHNYE